MVVDGTELVGRSDDGGQRRQRRGEWQTERPPNFVNLSRSVAPFRGGGNMAGITAATLGDEAEVLPATHRGLPLKGRAAQLPASIDLAAMCIRTRAFP